MPTRVFSRAAAISLMCFLHVEPALGQSREERVRSLPEHAISVRTIDPTDEDFSDLEAFRQILEPVRLVLLGEQTHGDGSTFLAKARLIKFLHQEMGFDVLAFESGLYECHKAEAQLQLGEAAHSAVRRCVFPMWTESAEFQPTIDYLQETRASDRPLRIAGFDSQVTGSASSEFLVHDLHALTEGVAPSFDWTTLEDILQGLADYRFGFGGRPPPPDDVRLAFHEALTDLRHTVAASPIDGREFWSQVLRSLSAHANATWVWDWVVEEDRASVESQTIRDRQMADNLLWLLDHLYTGKKVIVWAATGHIARNLDRIRVESDETARLYAHFRPMGSYLWEALGSEMYSVGFIAHEGAWGLAGMAPTSVPPGHAGTLEAMLSDAGFEVAFVDLRTVASSAAWLGVPTPSRLSRYVPMTAAWGEVVDGLFFIKVMTPSTRLVR